MKKFLDFVHMCCHKWSGTCNSYKAATRGGGGGGGGGTPIYKAYRYVPPQRVSFLSISNLK